LQSLELLPNTAAGTSSMHGLNMSARDLSNFTKKQRSSGSLGGEMHTSCSFQATEFQNSQIVFQVNLASCPSAPEQPCPHPWVLSPFC
jgi:hypothetical protein